MERAWTWLCARSDQTERKGFQSRISLHSEDMSFGSNRRAALTKRGAIFGGCSAQQEGSDDDADRGGRSWLLLLPDRPLAASAGLTIPKNE